MSTAELVELIDLSLGTEPCGVVNFNYLHGLLHEIVKRLVQLEAFQSTISPEMVQFDIQSDQARGGRGSDGRQTLTDQQTKSFLSGAGSKERVSLSQSNLGGTPEGGTQGGGAAADASKVGAEQPKRGASVQQLPSAAADPRARQTSASDVRAADRAPKQHPAEQSSSGAQLGASLSKSRRFAHSTAGIVGAANSVGALERKLEDLESRMTQMESLPELLEKKASDANSTPIRDLWNFTHLSKRLSGAEEGVDKTSQLVDTLLGEVQTIKSQSGNLVEALERKLSSDITTLKENLESLQQMASAPKSVGLDESTVRGMLKQQQDDYQGKVDGLRGDVEALKAEVKSSLSIYGEENVKKQTQTANAVVELKDQVNSMNNELTKLLDKLKELESSIAEKVNAADLESLMPKTDDGTSSLLPLIMELQQKVDTLEANALPSGFVDQVESMQATINQLTAELSSVSSSLSASSIDKGRLDELGSQLAQFKERLTDMDRSVTAIGNAVSRAQAPPTDEELSAKYAGVDAFEELQNTVAGIQQEQERLMGTAAHLAHELEVNKEHVKTLYTTSDDLKKTKADKSLVELEVQDKADRAALEGKASREWVDSTFERLDREIREAKSKLTGQEEAFKMAMSQINEDVDGKLDRNELEPLKEYFDKRLDRVKTAQPVQTQKEISADDAAGFRKPLQFRCISCDRPVGIKPLDAIPALPSGDTFPTTRSFRPYTTYELELIRRYQKLTYGGGSTVYSQAMRSAGGGHTMTRPHQRVRVAPPSSTPYTPETPPPPRQPITAHDETDIIGNDGHIYKGRSSTSRLPPLTKQSRRGPKRPTSSPHQQPVSS